MEGNVCDKHLLHEENIEGTDVFAAVTNDDEANVMSCLLAKDMGAHKVVALINNPAYVDLVQDKGIDIAIAPSQITIGTFLAEIEGQDVVKVHSLREGCRSNRSNSEGISFWKREQHRKRIRRHKLT